MSIIKKSLFCLLALIAALAGSAQFTEHFSDGDFTNNPVWTGTTGDWTINPQYQLQSSNTVANSTFYLCTASSLSTSAQWECSCKLGFNPSSVNYVEIYLTASAADLTLPSTTGYFVRMGGSDDEISLFRKDNGTVTRIIDGINGALNNSSNDISIKVVRDAANQWQLIRNINAAGLINEGNVLDATYVSASFFGVLVKQSTSGFFQKHFIDDIIAGPYTPDLLPPAIQSISVTGVNSIDVLFDEPLDPASSQLVSNYLVDNGLGTPASAVRDVSNAAIVHLTFAGSFPNRVNLLLTVNAVSDLSGNAISNGNFTFSYVIALQYDVVIDEIMADPTPLTGLPDAEWVELRNTTAFNIDLNGFRIGKPTGQSGPMPSYVLMPDSFVIVCSASAVAEMSAYGQVIPVTGFPALSNTGDLLYLLSAQGTIIHSVNYADSWYRNELKKDGGWTLEMTDMRNPCSGISNWAASVDDSGGTPGSKNSTDALNTDESVPKLLRAYATDSVNIVLVFDEPLDSTAASLASRYSISDGAGNPVSASPLLFSFDMVSLRLAGIAALARDKIYTVTVNEVTDCAGNSIGSANTARVGLVEHTDSFQIVINEILFNPGPAGTDYVEIYNRSTKILNLKNLYIANRNTSGVVSNIRQVSVEDYLLFPHDFLVLTESKWLVLDEHVAKDPNAFMEIPGMPSFPDDKGDVILLNEQGNIIDEVAYSENWHFKLISNAEGVSLERIDYNAASQDEGNWHSASTSTGYGTPTYKNAQHSDDALSNTEIKVGPEIVSPDNDGMDDFATISYHFTEPGTVAVITIFDAAGRPVRYLQRNALCGVDGYFRWDGLGEKNQQLPSGIYIIYTELFNLEGKKKKCRNVIVLARKVN